jgi:hypothetical protein
MNFAQFKRLFLVLLVPLLGLGLWFASSEVLIPTDFNTSCFVLSGEVSCVSALVKEKERFERWSKNDGVDIGRRAVTLEPVFAQVVMIDHDAVSSVQDMEAQLAGAPKLLVIGARTDPVLRVKYPCELSPAYLSFVPPGTDIWSLRCYDGKRYHFKFVDTSVNATFVSAVRLARGEAQVYETRAQLAFGVAACVPLLGFLLLSGLVYLFRKALYFVRYGRTNRPAHKT